MGKILLLGNNSQNLQASLAWYLLPGNNRNQIQLC